MVRKAQGFAQKAAELTRHPAEGGGGYVVRKVPGEPAVIEACEKVDYKMLSAAVGGMIARTGFPFEGIRLDIWLNDEGLVINLAPNIILPNGQPLVGGFLVCACTPDGDSVNISKELAEAAAYLLNYAACHSGTLKTNEDGTEFQAINLIADDEEGIWIATDRSEEPLN